MERTLYRRKQIIGLMTIVIIAIALITCLNPIVRADETEEQELYAGSQADVLTKEMLEIYDTTLSNKTVNGVTDILLGTNSGFYDKMVTSETSLGNMIMDVTRTLAGGLLLVYSIIAIIRAYETGEVNIDLFLKVLLKMVVAMVLVININPLLDTIQELGYNLATLISEAVSTSISSISVGETMDSIKTATYQSIIHFAEDPSGIGAAKALPGLTSSIMEIQSFCNPILLLLEVSVKTVSYSLFIELAIRKAFMPIAVVVLSEDGIRSPAMRYLKKFAAVYIKIAICIMAVGAAYAITSITSQKVAEGTISELSKAFSFIYDSFAVKSAALIFIRQGSTLADEILGV